MFGKYNKVGTRVYGGAPAIAPFGGTYTWWANINDAVFSNSGGIDYVDEVPLTGIADRLVQPTAVDRPKLIASGLDGNAVMRADASGMKIYKEIDASIFNGGSGTFAFMALINNIGSAKTLFTEATANATAYNFQIVVSSINNLSIYTDTDALQSLDTFTYAQYAVHHFTLSGTTFSYYKNGVFVQSRTINQNMNTARPLTAFNYKSINAEQGQGDMGDIAVLTGTALDATAIANDYTNFWKAKYPSLP
jgi:hypothetical protein